MSPLVRFERFGGRRPPADDELLVVEADGTFALRRTVGTDRAGDFAGRLSADDLAALLEELGAAEKEPTVSAAAPEGAVFERVAWEGVTATVHQGWTAPPDWRVVDRLRSLCDSGTSDPVAAIAIAVPPGATALHLEVVGTGELEVDVRNLEVDVEAVAWPNTGLGRWTGAGAELVPEEPEPAWELTPDGPKAGGLGRAPGWSVDVPLPHGLPLADAHELRVELRVWIARAGSGRTARLVLPHVRPTENGAQS